MKSLCANVILVDVRRREQLGAGNHAMHSTEEKHKQRRCIIFDNAFSVDKRLDQDTL